MANTLVLGKKKPRKFVTYAGNNSYALRNERITVFTGTKEQATENSIKSFVGYGIVLKIIKGNEFDIVKFNFGKGERNVIVQRNTARRQIYTLKVNQWAEVIGEFKSTKTQLKDGTWQYDLSFVAFALNGWFVPRSYDIKHDIELNENGEQMEHIEQEQEEVFVDILKQFEEKE